MPEFDPEVSNKPKGPVARFFNAGWSNLVRLMASNAFFILFNIPAIILAGVIAVYFVPWIAPHFIDVHSYIDPVTGNDDGVIQLYYFLVFFLITFLLSSTLVCIGPFQTGFAQVYKDINNNNSVSFFSSFKTGIQNWKKGLLSMFISIVLTPVLLLAIGFYLSFNSGIGTIIGSVFIVLLFALILVQNFVYTLIVSTDLKLSKIYKNAVLLVLIRFVTCLGISLVVIIFYVIIPFILLMSASYLTLGIFMFLYSFFVIAWVQYFISFYAGRLIEKYVAQIKEE